MHNTDACFILFCLCGRSQRVIVFIMPKGNRVGSKAAVVKRSKSKSVQVFLEHLNGEKTRRENDRNPQVKSPLFPIVMSEAVCDTCRLQTCRPADLQTCRLADLQTCRPADLETCRFADLQTQHADLS